MKHVSFQSQNPMGLIYTPILFKICSSKYLLKYLIWLEYHLQSSEWNMFSLMIVLGYDNLMIRKHQSRHCHSEYTSLALAWNGCIFIDIWHCTLPYNNQPLVQLWDLEKETWNLGFFLIFPLQVSPKNNKILFLKYCACNLTIIICLMRL